MVGRIINHDDGSLSPLWIDRVQVVAQLDQEESKSSTIVPATVDGIHQPTNNAHCCYDTERFQTLHCSDHVSLARPTPTMLSIISLVEHTFINIDNYFILNHILNVIGSSKLAL